MTLRQGRAQDVGARAVRGSLVGLVGVGLGIVTAIATVPLLLRVWSEHQYAVWLAVFAVYSLLQTVDTGHTGYLGNEFLRLAHDDRDGYQRAFASGLRLSLVIGAAQLLVALAILAGGFVPRVLGLPLAGTEAWTAGMALVALSLGWWASGSFGGVVAGLLFPAGDFVRAQWWAIASKLLLFGCLVVPALAGGGVLAAAVTTAIGQVLYTAGLVADAWRRYPQMRRWRAGASWGEALRNVRRSIVVTANNASTQLGISGLALAVAALVGAVALPAFTTQRTLTNAAAAVTAVAVSPIVPDMVRYRVSREWAKLLASFEACWFGVGLVVHLGILVTFPIVQQLYVAWTRGRIAFDAPLYALLAWAVGMAAHAAPSLRYLQAMNRLAPQTACNAVYLGALALCVPLSRSGLGLAGVGLSLAIAECVRAVLALWLVTREADAEAARALARTGARAASPLVLTGLALAAGVAWPAHRTAVSAFGAAAVALAYVWQWQALDPALRVRVRGALPWAGRLHLASR